MTKLALLPDRGVIEISGIDRVGFLQGLVSNDVALAAPGCAVWAALLTPQGKWLADFFIFTDADRLLLDVERGQIGMLLQRLTRYRLRAGVSLREEPSLAVYVAWGDGPRPHIDSLTAPDPRLPDAGWRILSDHKLPVDAAAEEWQAHRLGLGLPDGSRDLEADKTVLLEAGFDELAGVSWTKGCYMGQELTARTKYRGLVKRRLIPVTLSERAVSGSAITCDGAEVGVLRSVAGTRGLALLRLDAWQGPLVCGAAQVVAQPPKWMHLGA